MDAMDDYPDRGTVDIPDPMVRMLILRGILATLEGTRRPVSASVDMA